MAPRTRRNSASSSARHGFTCSYVERPAGGGDSDADDGAAQGGGVAAGGRQRIAADPDVDDQEVARPGSARAACGSGG
jgi:hypothetical protein